MNKSSYLSCEFLYMFNTPITEIRAAKIVTFSFQCPYITRTSYTDMTFIEFWSSENPITMACRTLASQITPAQDFDGFIIRVTRQIPLVEHELPTPREHRSSSQVFSGGSFSLILVFIEPLFVFSFLFIWPLYCLIALLPFTAPVYPLYIFIPFLKT